MELNDIINGGVPEVINESLIGKNILCVVKSIVKEKLLNIDEVDIEECRIVAIADEYVKFSTCKGYVVEEDELGKTVIASYETWWHNLNDITIVAVLRD